jgi:hypothetical protein
MYDPGSAVYWKRTNLNCVRRDTGNYQKVKTASATTCAYLAFIISLCRTRRSLGNGTGLSPTASSE